MFAEFVFDIFVLAITEKKQKIKIIFHMRSLLQSLETRKGDKGVCESTPYAGLEPIVQ